jgi:hypothetical protein
MYIIMNVESMGVISVGGFRLSEVGVTTVDKE